MRTAAPAVKVTSSLRDVSKQDRKITEELGDDVFSTEGELSQEEDEDQGTGTGEVSGSSQQTKTQLLPHDGIM